MRHRLVLVLSSITFITGSVQSQTTVSKPAVGTSANARVEVVQTSLSPLSVIVSNPCSERHYLRVQIHDAQLTLYGPDAIAIAAGERARVPMVDSSGTSRQLANAQLAVECLDCKEYPDCSLRIARERVVIERQQPAREATRNAGRLLQPVLVASYGARVAAATDVGIIPASSGGCPIGSELVTLSTDDEDDKNISQVSGWTGAISRYSTGTTMSFCRVDGTVFQQHTSRDYAVLKLGSSCPAGSMTFIRTFDNEHNNNNNWTSGNITPNQSLTNTTKLYFCFFPSGGAMSTFPNFQTAYGVFAAPWTGWLDTGGVFTDDEEGTNNADSTTWVGTVSTVDLNKFTKIIYGTPNAIGPKNTYLHVARVGKNAACVNPCPYIGSYDSVNCWIGQPPSGTTAFIYAANFYYTPVSGNQCPRPGSWFDTVNCFVTAIPPQTRPFIWANMWYVEPACRP